MPDRLMLLDSASPGAATDGGRLDVNLAAFGTPAGQLWGASVRRGG